MPLYAISKDISAAIHNEYPMIDLVWSDSKHCFEYIEKFTMEAVKQTRSLGQYRNPDGTPKPVCTDRVMAFLHRSDTRKWPLHERVALMRKTREEEKKRREAKEFESVENRILDDYSRIAGIPTFFFGPSMKVARESNEFGIGK